jgi:tRNA A37 threonylcarbamoyladenosine synthetase subunit TsaC/SUA5/YrdC
MQSTSWNGYAYIAPQPQEETVTEYSDPNPESYATPVTPNMGPDPVDIVLPATPVTPLPQWRDQMMRNMERRAYRMMQDPQVREIIAHLRAQARQEARARRWRRDF